MLMAALDGPCIYCLGCQRTKNHLIHELLPHIWKSQKLSQAIA